MAVGVWQGHRNAAWAPQCRFGLRARSRECGSFAMPAEDDAWDIAQLLPRGHRPQDVAGDARARARAARRSPRERPPAEARSPSVDTPPLRSPSVDSEADISPTARERVVLWGRSIAAHWASGRSGRAPSGMLFGEGGRGDPSAASAAADSGPPGDSGARDRASAPIESLDEASGDLGHQPRIESRGALHEDLVTEAPAQLVTARGDMVGSESRAGSSRVEEAAAPWAQTTGPPVEAQSPRFRGVFWNRTAILCWSSLRLNVASAPAVGVRAGVARSRTRPRCLAKRAHATDMAAIHATRVQLQAQRR